MYYSLPATAALKKLKTKPSGLTEKQAKARLKKYGLNELPPKPPRAVLSIFIDQLKSPLIYILLFALIVTLFLKHFTDSIVISMAVFMNTIFGFIQEYKAQRALISLKEILTPRTEVTREGKVGVIEARFLVPGEIVILKPGYKVPADARLIEAKELKVNEAPLTGESNAVSKFVKALSGDTEVSDQKNMVFWGTSVVSGHAKAVVVATGIKSELGKIAQVLKEQKEEKTPLQRRITELGRFLTVGVGLISFLILLSGLLFGHSFVEMFTTAVALAVAAIPEGLAVSLTVILTIGMQRILKRKALVRKLVAAETLGSTTVICADKTGTITEGKMRLTHFSAADDEEAIKVLVLCNNLEGPTELAIWDWVRQTDHRDPQKIFDYTKRLAELPFNSERKFMATLHPLSEGSNIVLFKGAPELLLNWCRFPSHEDRKHWFSLTERWGKNGLRLLALAKKEVPGNVDLTQFSDYHNLSWLGLVGMEDPVREEVKGSFSLCRKAGIKVVVITGDYRLTGEVIMKKLGLEITPEQIMEGKELKEISADNLRRRVDKIVLYARVTPVDKLKIVQALQERGEVVAMTGDGINDAPALKKADIGVAVDTATDVAKETADIVLLDGNFKTIVAAVEEGRGIFDNLQKVILYLLSDSFSEVSLVLFSIILNLPLPLTASQILWINLITDGFPNLALTVDPKEKEIMREPPRNPKENLLNFEIRSLVILISFFTALTSLLIFLFFLSFYADLKLARSVVFASLGVDSLLYVFSVRSLRHPILKKDPFSNKYLLAAVGGGFALQISSLYVPFLQRLLGVVPLGIFEWVVVGVTSLLVIILIEATKFIFLRRKEVGG